MIDEVPENILNRLQQANMIPKKRNNKNKNTHMPMIDQNLKDHLKAAQQIKHPVRIAYAYSDPKQKIDCTICPYCKDIYYNPMRL